LFFQKKMYETCSFLDPDFHVKSVELFERDGFVVIHDECNNWMTNIRSQTSQISSQSCKNPKLVYKLHSLKLDPIQRRLAGL
jgi:hypothetical protein